MRVKYAAAKFTTNDRICVKLTATDSTTGVDDAVYTYTAYPETITPTVSTSRGSYF